MYLKLLTFAVMGWVFACQGVSCADGDFASRSVTFSSAAAGVRLAGTLTVPVGSGEFPGLVLVAGSGKENRDGNILGHPILRAIADYLSRQGFVVLRYDKRGVGQSTGSYESATTRDFAQDALGAFDFLKTVSHVDLSRIGILGTSEGGLIAPLVASNDPDIKFVVLLAAPAVPCRLIIEAQTANISAGNSSNGAERAKLFAFEQGMLTIVQQESNPISIREDATRLYDREQPIADKAYGSRLLKDQLKQVTSPWFRYFLHYNPVPEIEKLAVPVLALYGSRDQQINAAQNTPAMREELAQSVSHEYEVDDLSGLNHLFEDCRTGNITEYRSIRETISPTALKTIGKWLGRVVQKQ